MWFILPRGWVTESAPQIHPPTRLGWEPRAMGMRVCGGGREKETTTQGPSSGALALTEVDGRARGSCLLDKLDDPGARLWYVQNAVEDVLAGLACGGGGWGGGGPARPARGG